MANILGLSQIWGPAETEERPVVAAAPSAAPTQFADWVSDLANTVADLKARVEQLERQLATQA
jgi:ubiquinone biosynthesis protein UbiJ